MRKEAFKSKGYTGVDVFKVAQIPPLCKGTKTGRASGTERQERGKADTDCDETESEHTPPTETLPGGALPRSTCCGTTPVAFLAHCSAGLPGRVSVGGVFSLSVSSQSVSALPLS